MSSAPEARLLMTLRATIAPVCLDAGSEPLLATMILRHSLALCMQCKVALLLYDFHLMTRDEI